MEPSRSLRSTSPPFSQLLSRTLYTGASVPPLPLSCRLLCAFWGRLERLCFRRFYLAFDHNDVLYEKESFRQHIDAEFRRMLAVEVREMSHIDVQTRDLTRISLSPVFPGRKALASARLCSRRND
jgi:hypothetical protein